MSNNSNKPKVSKNLNDLDIAEANTLFHENRSSNTSIKSTWKLRGHTQEGNTVYETPAGYEITQNKLGRTIKMKDLQNPPEIEGEQ